MKENMVSPCFMKERERRRENGRRKAGRRRETERRAKMHGK